MSLLRGTGARLAAGATLALLAVSGCSATQTQTPVATPSSSPTPAPLFANDAEALAAAKKAYEAYLAMSDLILSQGGRDGTRIKSVASRELAESELEGYDMALAKGWHTVGRSKYRNLTVQAVRREVGDGIGIVTAYLCSDMTGVDVLDSRGESVAPKTRSTGTPMEVAFDLQPTSSGGLLVGSRSVWSGEGVC